MSRNVIPGSMAIESLDYFAQEQVCVLDKGYGKIDSKKRQRGDKGVDSDKVGNQSEERYTEKKKQAKTQKET